MAKTTANNNALVKSAEQRVATPTTNKPANIKDLLEARMGEIQKVLPSVISPTQFLRLALNAIQTTPHLMECSMSSFYGAIMQCAQLGLKPNCNGEGYLIPFWNAKKNCYEVQFMSGYKGLMLLARRSGEIDFINAQTVYENDEFDLIYGSNPDCVHKPFLKGDRGEPVGFYAIVKLKDGGCTVHWMTVADAKKYGKKYSKTYNNGPWQTDFESMAKKSCLRQALKYAPMSTDMDAYSDRDGKVLNFNENAIDGGVITVDEPDGTEVEETPTEPIQGDTGEIKADSDGVIIHDEPGEADDE